MANVDIIIRMIDQTGGASNKTSANLKSLASNVAAVSAAFVAAGLAAKKFYDFAEAGAQLDFTKIKFDRLAQTIGTTGDSLLKKLRPATRGVMSDMELIASATDTMSLGLVRNERDAVRLTTVMAGLGMDMNQVVLALSNQTTMRFDQLGVAVNGFDEKLKALKATGMDTNAAFTEAFLQQAEEQLTKVGHAADTALGEFMQFESTWKNLTDEMKVSAAEAFAPAIASFNDMTQAGRETRGALNELYDAGVITSKNFRQLSDEDLLLIAQMQRGAAMTQFYGQQFQSLAPSLDSATMSQEQFKESLVQLSQLMQTDLTDAQKNYSASIADLQAQLASAKESERGGIIAQIEAETAAYNERATAIMFNIQQQAIMAAAESGQIDYSQASQAISTLAQEYGLIDEQQKAVMDSTQQLIDAFSETGNIDNFTSGLQALRDSAMATPGPIDETTGAAAAFAERIQQVVELLGRLPPSGTSWDYSFSLAAPGQTADIVNTETGQTVNQGTSTNPVAKASGGAFSGWALTGDSPSGLTAHSELVYAPHGAYVYNAQQTRNMLAGGMGGVDRYASGGAIALDGVLPVASTRPSDLGIFTSTATRTADMSAPSVVADIIAPTIGALADISMQQQSALVGTMAALDTRTMETNRLLSVIAERVATAPDIGRAVNSDRSKYS